MRLAVVLDCSHPETLAEFWAAALDYEQVHADETYVGLRSRDGSRPSLVLQRVPEVKATKNRMHLDIHTDDFSAHLNRLATLGASTLTAEHVEHGLRLAVLADPEGNEFCLVAPATVA